MLTTMMELLVIDSWADGGRSTVEEWVASLPVELSETAPAAAEPVRRKGVFQARPSNAADVYQMAQAARKARDRQASRTSVVSRGEAPGEKISDRVGMLRNAYAAQRLDRSDGTVSASFDSSNLELEDEEEEEYPVEELLLDLGFGGPPQGLERVPERFLQPSQMRGVDLEQLWSQQQEIDDAMDSVFGYRGLSGPPSRRPSNIVARLYEKMKEQQSLNNKSSSESRRKSSGQPSSFATSSFEHHHLPSQPEENIVETLHEKLVSKLHQISTDTILIEDDPATLLISTANTNLNNSSLASSSRRSSLKRQDRFENEEEFDVIEATLPHKPEIEMASAIGLPMAGYIMGPAVYVTPPGSVTGRTQVLVHPADSDPIFAVLQLAAEAYRVRLDGEKQATLDDWNHNNVQQELEEMSRVKLELKKELDRTDDLLARLRNRLTLEQRISYDSSNLRSILDDMTALLQHQRDLYDRVSEWRNPSNSSADPSEPDRNPTSSSPTTVSSAEQQCQPEEEDFSISGWMERFERRLTSRIRNTVRREIKRARHVKKRNSKFV